jgi:uncharacterized membrane protein
MNAHLFVIHFPISLVFIAATLDLAGVALDDRSLRDWCWRFLLAGAFAVFLAFVTGEGAKLDALSSGEIDFLQLELHQQWGSVGTWAVVGAALLRTLWRNRLSGSFGWLNLSIVLLTAGLLVAITVSGTLVRHFG